MHTRCLESMIHWMHCRGHYNCGYWQVEMEGEDKEKTAFSTPFGLFNFKVMPFRLTNAPSTFQSLMDLVLKGLHWSICLVYLEDIIVFSKSLEEHIHHLKQVFERLRSAGLKIRVLCARRRYTI